jgi:hypothetical protein
MGILKIKLRYECAAELCKPRQFLVEANVQGADALTWQDNFC